MPATLPVMRGPVMRGWNSARGAGWALAAILTLGAGMRLAALGRASLIYDECASVLIARLDWRRFFGLLYHREANMALYYLLLRGWLWLGRSEAAARSLSVIFGVAGLAAAYALGRKLFDRATGLVTALLLALNMLALRYSQDARGYMLYFLLTALAGLALIEALEKGGGRRWVVYIILAAAAVYSQFFAGLFLSAQWLWALAAQPSLIPWPGGQRRPDLNAKTPAAAFAAAARARRQRWGFWLSVAATLLLVAPLMAFVLFHNRGQLAWIPAPDFGQITNLIEALSGEGAHTLAGLAPLWWLWCGLAAAGAGLGLWRRRKAAQDENQRANAKPGDTAVEATRLSARQATGLLALWLILPIVLTYMGSLLVEPVFVNRYLLPCLLPWAMLAARGMLELLPDRPLYEMPLCNVPQDDLQDSLPLGSARSKQSPVAWLRRAQLRVRRYRWQRLLPYALALLVTLEACADVSYYLRLTAPWRQATRYLAQHFRPGDRILAFPAGCAVLLSYNLLRLHHEKLLRAATAGDSPVLLYPANHNIERLLRHRGIHRRAKLSALRELRRLPAGTRVWMLLALNNQLKQWAQRMPQGALWFHGEKLAQFRFGQMRFYQGLYLLRYEKRR